MIQGGGFEKSFHYHNPPVSSSLRMEVVSLEGEQSVVHLEKLKEMTM